MRSRKLLFLGLALLALGSYFDTVRGILLSSITQSLGIDYAQASGFLVSGYLAAIVCSLSLQAICDRYPLRRFIGFALAVGVIAAHFSYLAISYGSLLVLGFGLGTVVSMLGSLSNIAVIEGTLPGHRSRWLCVLHVMYGLGSQGAPLYVAWNASHGHPWQVTISVLTIPLALAFLWTMTLPRVYAGAEAPVGENKLKPEHWLVIALFSVYGLGEVMISAWMTVYLTAARSMSVSQAAPWVSGFFWVIAGMRMLSAFVIPARYERLVVQVSLLGSCLLFLAGRLGLTWAFSLAGILGPFFPLAVSHVTHRYPRVGSRVIVLSLMGLQLSVGAGHWLMGTLTDRYSIQTAYWLPFGALLVAFLLVPRVFRD